MCTDPLGKLPITSIHGNVIFFCYASIEVSGEVCYTGVSRLPPIQFGYIASSQSE